MMDRVAIFNYMIGNTDWSVPNQHNCKVLSAYSQQYPGLGILVPYDFDYSGLVNADYAVPFEGLGIKSVQERRYLGICRTEQNFRNDLIIFQEKKEAFYQVIRKFPFLAEKTKKVMLEYLDSFYSGFDNRYSIVEDILSGCNKF